MDESAHSNSYSHHPPSPGYFTDGTPSGPLLTEPTQLEVCEFITIPILTR